MVRQRFVKPPIAGSIPALAVSYRKRRLTDKMAVYEAADEGSIPPASMGAVQTHRKYLRVKVGKRRSMDRMAASEAVDEGSTPSASTAIASSTDGPCSSIRRRLLTDRMVACGAAGGGSIPPASIRSQVLESVLVAVV